MAEERKVITRREFLAQGLRGAGGLLGVAVIGMLSARAVQHDTVWQIDPSKCIQCGNCATACVLKPSAVKCVHAFAQCGYCELCSVSSRPSRPSRTA